MSSIDPKNPSALPAYVADGADAPPPTDTPADTKIRQMMAEKGGAAIIAMMGMTPAGLDRVLKGEPSNKFSLASTITSSAPSLPQDRAPVTPETQALFASMHQDVATAMAGAQPPKQPTVGAATTSQTAGAQVPGTDMLSQLAQITEAEAKTPAGQAKVNEIVTQSTSAAIKDFGNMSNSGMMAAFMILQVQNKASGKEVTSTLQDLTSDARKQALRNQIDENMAAQKAADKAQAKMDKMGVLAPLIEAIVAVSIAVFTALTLGAGLPLLIAVAGMAAGFLIGGAVGGAQKGTGFDITSAFTGLGIGAGIGTMAASVAKLASAAIMRAVDSVLLRVASNATAKSMSQKMAMSLNNIGANSSTKISMATNGFLGAVVTGVGDAAKSGMNYDYTKKLLLVKEHQANAKMAGVIAELLQNQFTSLQGSLRSMQEMHNTAVTQMLAMMKTQFAATQKTVSQLSG